MNNTKSVYYILGAIVILLIAIFALTRPVNGPGVEPGPEQPGPEGSDGGGEIVLPGEFTGTDALATFGSATDFKAYLAKADEQLGNGLLLGYSVLQSARSLAASEMAVDFGADIFDQDSFLNESAGLGGGAEPDRFSGTNVQVVGIDEPDIVKTDGKEIYFSSSSFARFIDTFVPTLLEGDVIMERKIASPQRRGELMAIKAFPPADLEVDSAIDQQGEMLLHNDQLVIFSGNHIYGYNVSNPAKPDQNWDISLENRTQVVTSRLFNDKIYMITKTWVNHDQPCPIRPLSLGSREIVIPCTRIHHPISPIPVDSTFTVMTLNPASGEIENESAFVGSSSQSVVSMSPQAIYVTYQRTGDMVSFIIGFFKENSDLVPGFVITRLEKLRGYELSTQAKLTELMVIFQEFQNSIEGDAELRLSNELTNRMSDYGKQHLRELMRLGIVKISTDSLKVMAQGEVPGRPLNQFSLDEYDGYLRVATTIDSRGDPLGITNSLESQNDVYVLDGNLNITSSVQGLGLTERVFAVRFVQDKGYVVTFRQTDPFYVIDLADPNNAKVAGELKIPGFSSYLHPIAKDQILGIGREGSQVKLSMFDVSDPNNPTEQAKYMLDESWSEIQNTHHAFLQDAKHKIFFLPGGKGGYVFTHEDGSLPLKLQRAVGDIRARRAIFINDYLYVVGDDKLVVLSETDWQRVNELRY